MSGAIAAACCCGDDGKGEQDPTCHGCVLAANQFTAVRVEAVGTTTLVGQSYVGGSAFMFVFARLRFHLSGVFVRTNAASCSTIAYALVPGTSTGYASGMQAFAYCGGCSPQGPYPATIASLAPSSGGMTELTNGPPLVQYCEHDCYTSTRGGLVGGAATVRVTAPWGDPAYTVPTHALALSVFAMKGYSNPYPAHLGMQHILGQYCHPLHPCVVPLCIESTDVIYGTDAHGNNLVAWTDTVSVTAS